MDLQLVALMLTDMSGYTEFSSHSDRQAVSAAIQQQQRLILATIEQFHGRLICRTNTAGTPCIPQSMRAPA